MELVNPRIETYLKSLIEEPDPVRAAMEKLGAERDFPIIGPMVGNLCMVLALSVKARRVFELGSGFGYSTLWFARAVGPEGSVVHTDGSAENTSLAKDFLARAGLGGRFRFETGDGRQILRHALERGDGIPVDVVFNDIDKEQYPDVLPLARKALRPGGLLISDNMIWSGRVTEPDPDAATRGILELTRSLRAATDFTTTLIPLRDGVTVSVKR